MVSSCPEAWGGSEELWAGAALHLKAAGHEVQAFKTNVDYQHPRILGLHAAGCQVTDLEQLPALRTRLLNRLLPYHRQYSRRRLAQQVLRRGLLAFQPGLVLVSQGSNFDGIPYAQVCQELGLPFVLLAQKAVDFFFPPWYEREVIQAAYRAARHCYFVARHNLELTQFQLGQQLPAASVVWNPYNVPFHSESPLPSITPEATIRLACVARLEVLDKGLDLLLQVLSQDKWRNRPLQVTCFGSGADRQALEEMTAMLRLGDTVRFAGQVSDVQAIWQSHHALVLPSRNEGLPLALVEAMLCGRPAIATNAGGIGEILVDNETGFLAESASVAALDQALERAWRHRTDWQRLGSAAARHARATVPTDPARHFSEKLRSLALV
ncbi:hypothetical protein GCM10023185_32630 [Hymenobacter saemangeumensis]|uniref:Glycosyl transferase family 1 domain-containing protein n=1 Tax=Hymenobacter saemangeumensis TaxID=1084522 RepID=A0ABP8IMV3_9BACT